MKTITGFIAIAACAALAGCNVVSSEDYRGEANRLKQRQQYRKAIQVLDKAIEADPQNISALLDRGIDKALINDAGGAIEDYTKVLAIDQDNGLALLNRGKSKMKAEDYCGAVVDFNHAVEAQSRQLAIHKTPAYDVKPQELRLQRGIAYYHLDSLKQAFEDFNFSISCNYMLSECYYGRGMIYLRYEMKKEGCADLANAKYLGNRYAQELIDKYGK